MKKTLIGLVVVVLVSGFMSAVAPSVAGADPTPPPPTLRGESFHAGNEDEFDNGTTTVNITQTPDCDATSGDVSEFEHHGGFTATFSSSGIALGPYAGTYTETGSFTVSPTLDPDDNRFFMLTTFQSSFTITSGVHTVTGSFTTSTSGDNALDSGYCYDEPDGQEIVGGGSMDYTATITGPEGTYTGSGTNMSDGASPDSMSIDYFTDGDPADTSTQFEAQFFTSSAATAPVATDPTVYVGDASVLEGDSGATALVFTASLDVPVSSTVKLGYSTADLTSGVPATAGTDYTTKSGTVTIPKGATSATFSVNVKGDLVTELDEQFLVNLTSVTPSSVRIGRATAIGTIRNDDPSNTVSLSDVTVNEGNSGNTPVAITATLAFPAKSPFTATYQTFDGTAVAPSDYTAKTGTVSFAKGATSATITINVKGDTVVEPDEQFVVGLTGATGGANASTISVVTITNDDSTDIVSIANFSADEGSSGTTPFVIPVTLAFPAPSPIKVTYTTVDEDATSPSDYTAKSGTLTFATGATSANITVNVKGDTTVEPGEQFDIDLTAVTSGPATIDPNNSVSAVQIQNDDFRAGAVISDSSVTEGNSGTKQMTFNVTLDELAPNAIKITYATSDGTAVAPSDYAAKTGTVTIPQGAVSGSFTVTVKGDTTVEPNETFTVTLTGVTSGSARIVVATATGTIMNDDNPPPTAPPSHPGTPTGSAAPGSGAPGSGTSSAIPTATP